MIIISASAHSYLPPSRRWNHADVDKYLRDLKAGRPAVAGEEILSPAQGMIEAVYLGLRQTGGISFSLFERQFGEDFRQVFGAAPAGLAEEGLLRVSPAGCALTRQGMLFLDSVAARLVGEIG